MKFHFYTTIESSNERSVFHFLVKELGASPQFDKKKVVTEYEGTQEDEMFKKIASLYETQPNHVITFSRT